MPAVDGGKGGWPPPVKFISLEEHMAKRRAPMETEALRKGTDEERYAKAVEGVLAAFARLTPGDLADRVSDARETAGREIAQALQDAPRIGVAVLEVLLAYDHNRAGAGAPNIVVPDSLRSPADAPSSLQVGYADAATLYRTVAKAGLAGVARRELGRDLSPSRRRAALNRLHLSGVVSESRVPNPDKYPPRRVWLHATGPS